MIDPAGRDLVRKWLASAESLEIPVLSGSMWPIIRVGDWVRIRATSAEGLHRGDIVLIERPDHFVVHRLWSTKPVARTRGDCALRFDPPTQPDQIAGRAVAVRRGGRWVSLPGFPWSIILAAAAVAAASVRPRVGAALRRLRVRSRTSHRDQSV